MIADKFKGPITYQGEIPPEVEPSIERLVDELLVLLPSWNTRLYISYQSNGRDGLIADCSTDYKYRYSNITVYQNFIRYLEQDRKKALTHEFCHIVFGPMKVWVRAMIDNLFDLEELKAQQALKACLLRELEERNESVTSDLSQIVLKLMEEAHGKETDESGKEGNKGLRKERASSYEE